MIHLKHSLSTSQISIFTSTLMPMSEVPFPLRTDVCSSNVKGLESYAVGIDMDVDTPDETPLMTLTLISIVVHAFFVCAMHC